MNIQEAERVIVVSDPHGHPELIQNALDDAGFDVARDGLICAGDLVDGDLGPREAREELDLLKRNQAQILWGNHDVAVLLDYRIDYQREWSRPDFTEAFRAVFAGDGPLRWRYAVRVQGVFVTHAGISTDYLNDFLYADRNKRVDDPDGFVERLNAMFEQAVRRQLRSGRKDKLNRIMGRRAPHRFRVFREDMGPERVLPGVIAGGRALGAGDVLGKMDVRGPRCGRPAHGRPFVSSARRYGRLSLRRDRGRSRGGA